MRKTRILTLFLALPLALAMAVSCSRQDPMAEKALDRKAGPQLEQNGGGAAYCTQCSNGCILGWDFNPNNQDGNHPQGGYPIMLVEGDCKCEQQNGYWSATYGFNVVTHYGQVGGPGSGSIGSLSYHAQSLWGFNCVGGGYGGALPGAVGGWDQWVDVVGHHYSLPGSTPIGVASWPVDWNVDVHPGPVENHVVVDLPGSQQSGALSHIRILNGAGNTVAAIPSMGEPSYDLDLAALPFGEYTFELEFAPGWTLRTGMIKYDPDSGH